jgi:hypothetical protein
MGIFPLLAEVLAEVLAEAVAGVLRSLTVAHPLKVATPRATAIARKQNIEALRCINSPPSKAWVVDDLSKLSGPSNRGESG